MRLVHVLHPPVETGGYKMIDEIANNTRFFIVTVKLISSVSYSGATHLYANYANTGYKYFGATHLCGNRTDWIRFPEITSPYGLLTV